MATKRDPPRDGCQTHEFLPAYVNPLTYLKASLYGLFHQPPSNLDILNTGGSPVEQTALKQLYIDELRDLYSAESQLIKALPKLAKAATSNELRTGFEEHLEQTRGHVERLEKIFTALDEKPTGKKCKGMQGLVEEGQEMIEGEELEREALDAGLISAAQRVEHYEIAAYGTVRTFAKILGENHAVSLLEQTLEEEKQTDQKLTDLSRNINVEAAQSGSEKGEEAGTGTRSVHKGKAARA
jgi:ferritin-like metal-binding protein YciE